MSAPARRGLTEQAANAAIDQACRMLRGLGVDDRGVYAGVGCVIEGAQRLFAGEGGSPDAAFGAPLPHR